MALKVLDDTALLVFKPSRPARHVALAGEEQDVVVFLGLRQGGHQANRVSEVNVLVHESMDHQQLP